MRLREQPWVLAARLTTLKGLRINPKRVFVPFDSVLCEEASEFILERNGLVVIFLVANVSDDLVDIGRRNGKRTVSGLPAEIGD